jgi:hypothetical protein
MGIATYNVENLFRRAKALNSDDPTKTTELQNVAELQELIEHPVYSDADKKRILEPLAKHQALGESGPFFLRETRPRLDSNGKIVGDGRGDWVDWIEWRRDLISAAAIKSTRCVISETQEDVLCLVELESRPVPRQFDDTILKRVDLQKCCRTCLTSATSISELAEKFPQQLRERLRACASDLLCGVPDIIPSEPLHAPVAK